MSQESNAGSRRTDGGLASALNALSVGHQPRQSEHLVSYHLQQDTSIQLINPSNSAVTKQHWENCNVTSAV